MKNFALIVVVATFLVGCANQPKTNNANDQVSYGTCKAGQNCTPVIQSCGCQRGMMQNPAMQK
ncbi:MULTISPECIES: hypothetical protein [Campylobacter]|uniref:hypothetical protein n=1 Tax=Campylobacter TaxID=194 RepID=UPI001475310B|nr:MULTISPECIES: hypothetical protein [unclassified Campylobacter]MBE3021586.1 hypothetical protein [Campylobacter sp. 7477a]MBE3609918.1 hypothetical protein [Campylobacter sp. RM12916]